MYIYIFRTLRLHIFKKRFDIETLPRKVYCSFVRLFSVNVAR